MKILLVEDVRSIATLLSSRLRSYGHDVRVAENGKVAIATFRDLAPDLVLMDIEMPLMNGFEAATHIRAIEAAQQWAWTPIMFLTASDTPENLVTAIEAGGDDFLVKTVPEVVLQAKMKAMARIAALRQRLAFANAGLHEQASRDGLTGLLNRRQMDLQVDTAWEEALRTKQPFALLMIDVDHFKNYNDHYGHLTGDDCLRAVAEVLADTVATCNTDGTSSSAFAARYGGEEFAVILPRASSAAHQRVATLIVEGLRRLNRPHERNAEWGFVTASIGGARIDPASGTLPPLFRTADANLYRAKQQGRNRFVLD
jgi:diguanylate cyclase (GGDEF)-like protein